MLANLLQQGSGVVLILLLPGILGVQQYSHLTVLSTLISLSLLADLGISHVYSRKLPTLLMLRNDQVVLAWDLTVLAFRVLGASLFGLVAALFLGYRTDDWGVAALLPLFFSVAAVGTFALSQSVVRSRFDEVKQISLVQSLIRLSCIPGALVAGVGGWVGGQILANVSFAVVAQKRHQLRALLRHYKLFQWCLIREHLAEAFVLCLIAAVWSQFLMSGRLFAVLYYPDRIVAGYGLAGALYQLGTAVVISVFVPQTVALYRLFPGNPAEGIIYAFRIAAQGSAAIFVLAVGAVFLAPPLLTALFPDYHLPSSLIAPLILSLVNCAVASSMGSVLIGAGLSRHYLILMLLAFSLSLLLVPLLTPWFAYDAAAFAQLLALSGYSLGLISIVCWHFGKHLRSILHVCVTACLPLLVVVLALFLAFGPLLLG